MKYFNLNIDDKLLFGVSKLGLELSSKAITNVLVNLKTKKQDFRNLIDNYDNMTIYEQFIGVREFYKFNDYQYYLNHAKQTVKNGELMTVKTNDLQAKTFEENCYFKDIETINVYANKKLKKKFERYFIDDETLSKLENKDLLRVVDDRYSHVRSRIHYFYTPFENAKCDAEMLKKLSMTDSVLLDALTEVCLPKTKEELKRDYEYIFVPMYKEALRRLAESAKKSIETRNENIANMELRLNQAKITGKEENESIKNLIKTIEDQTKGR